MGNPDVFTYMIPRHCQLTLFEGVFIHSLASIGLGKRYSSRTVQAYRLHKRLCIFFSTLLRRSDRVGCSEATSSLINLCRLNSIKELEVSMLVLLAILDIP